MKRSSAANRRPRASGIRHSATILSPSKPSIPASLAATIATLPAANQDLNSMVVALEHCRQVGMEEELPDTVLGLSGSENAWLAAHLLIEAQQIQAFLALQAASAQAVASRTTGGAN